MSRVQPQQASSSSSSDGKKETTNSRSVLQLLRPGLILMRVCGISTGPHVTVENIGCTDDRFRLLHKDGWFHILYCVLINSYLWIYTGILACNVALLVPMSSEWIIVFQIMALNCMASGLCTWASLNYRDATYQSWCKDFYLYEQRYGVHENMKNMVKKSRMVVAFVMSSGICVTGVMFTYVLVIQEVGELTFVNALGWLNYLISIINYFIYSILTTSSFVGAVIGTYPLCSELDVINIIMKRCVEQNMNHQENQTFRSECAPEYQCVKLTDIIRRHKHICSLISGYGDSIAYFQFGTFFMSLPLSCFSLYVLLTRMESQNNVFLCTFILVSCSVSFIVMSVTGVRVNVKAHAALQCVLKISTADLSETTMREVNQSTSLLTGTTIGYSVYGLFTITPSNLLTIVGTLVTYFVVVLQFRAPDCETSLDILWQDLVANVTLLLEGMRNATSHT
ncbi:uncharacterized protein LOC124133453 [Haliotis rufescens]|uniref:uncharacterized protein LOC124133453 n=1 Tax=Haliotis rufescens TaxID=6454 RepID=UPI001EB061D9|nr:uncharacterized protein LOC124133453 [Haliotis rufescens]